MHLSFKIWIKTQTDKINIFSLSGYMYYSSHCFTLRNKLHFTGQDTKSYTLSSVERNTNIHYIFTELNNSKIYLDTTLLSRIQFLCHFLDNLSPQLQALGCCIPDIVTLIHYHKSLNMNSNPAMHPSFRLLKML